MQQQMRGIKMELKICLQALIKMGWLIFPVIILLIFWGIYEAMETKWERRFNK